jgi:hypothetical protein
VTATFFRLMCMGGIVCLTPLAVYLVYVVTMNRRPRPSVVDGVWDFVGVLAGLAGFLFCLGVVLGGVATDARIVTGGRAERIPDGMPWQSTYWLATTAVYSAVVLGLVVRGVRSRRWTLQVLNADLATVEGCVADAFAARNVDVDRRGWDWHVGGKPVLHVQHFESFRSTTLLFADAEIRGAVERHLREQMPKQPAAADNPAVAWVNTVLTCSVVAVGCLVVLIFVWGFIA